MEKIAKFEKVSFEEFCGGLEKCFPSLMNVSEDIYKNIALPKRATVGSAGYDFFAPFDIEIKAQEEVLIPTGIRASMSDNYVLMLFPRSSLGFKYRLQLNNTVGVIDSDYYHAKNEGHIFCKLTNDSKENKAVKILKGQGMIQGIFLPFGLTIDDEVSQERTGGIGSTTKKES